MRDVNMYQVCNYASCMQLCIKYAIMYHVCNYVSCMQLCMKYAIMRQVCTSLHTALNNSKHPKLLLI